MRVGIRQILGWIAAAALVGAAAWPVYADGPAVNGAGQVPWKTLTFGASKWLNQVTTRIEIGTVDAAEAAAAAAMSEQGEPFAATGPTVRLIDVRTTIDPAVGATVQLSEKFWFDSSRGNVLFGETMRTGQEEYLRRFRFTRQGAYRHRREPSSSAQANLPPEQWSDEKASFYAYEAQKWGCSQILVPSALIYQINKVNLMSSEHSAVFCVFNKRQLYRVTLHHGGTRIVDVDYQAQSSLRRTDVQKQISAVRLLLQAAPLGDYRGEVEDFSFLGFKKDVELFFDPSSRLPVMISGHVPTLGHSVLRLKVVQLGPWRM